MNYAYINQENNSEMEVMFANLANELGLRFFFGHCSNKARLQDKVFNPVESSQTSYGGENCIQTLYNSIEDHKDCV